MGININGGSYIHVLPIEAGFVGADNVGVLIAEEMYKQAGAEAQAEQGEQPQDAAADEGVVDADFEEVK